MRYTSRERAQEHVDYLKEQGSEAIIEEVTVFDVYVTWDHRVGSLGNPRKTNVERLVYGGENEGMGQQTNDRECSQEL